MMLRGRQVELITTQNVVLVDRPEDFWILSDDHGEMMDPCHVLICKCSPSGRPPGEVCNPRDLDDARSYYEGRKRFRGWIPRFSMGPWRQVALISEIRYLRDRPPPFRHPFDKPVRCYVSTSSPKTYKISLPKGCILNDHGFVEP